MMVIFTIPAFSPPGTVGCDQHLAAVVRVRVVHVHLQLSAFVLFHDGEQIFALEESADGVKPSPTLARLEYLLSSARACTSFIKVSEPIM